MIEIRPYQRLAIDSFRQSPLQRKLLVMSTGLGKTLTGLLLAKEMNTKTLWLAHTQELVDQPYRAAQTAWPEAQRGIVRAEHNQYMRDLVFASIQSAQQPKRIEQLAGAGFGLIVIDEAHHALSPGYKALLGALGCFSAGGPQLLGLTATPERTDNAPLEEVFEAVVFQMGITSAIEQGYLVPPVVVTRPINVDLDSITISRGDYGQKQLDIALMKAGIVQEICNGYEQHCIGRKTIAFVISVDQAEQVASELRRRGYRFMAVSGETEKEERKRILQRLKSGDLDGVVNCMVLTEGFDEPSVSAIILGRPTQSKPLTIQKVGRGLRLFPGKTDCLVVDMVGISKRHSMVQAAVLFGAEQEEKPPPREGFNPITQPEDYWRERMRTQIEGVGGAPRSALRWVPGDAGAWLLDAGVYGAVRMLPASSDMWNVDAVGITIGAHKRLQLSDSVVSMDTAQAIAEDYVRRVNAVNKAASDAAWRNRMASDAEIKKLRLAGKEVSRGLKKGTAADLQLQTRAVQAVTPATSKQLYYLRLHGIKFEPGLTKKEAQGLIVKSTFRKRAQ